MQLLVKVVSMQDDSSSILGRKKCFNGEWRLGGSVVVVEEDR
jgi:hypothetical protein